MGETQILIMVSDYEFSCTLGLFSKVSQFASSQIGSDSLLLKGKRHFGLHNWKTKILEIYSIAR